MQTIDRAMMVARILSANEMKRWLSISELSKECGLPMSSMHRLLQALIKHGLIQQDQDTKLYSLGNTWMEYGLQMYDSMDFVSLIRPELEKLMHVVQESVYYSKPIGDESMVVERIDCLNNPIRINDQLGIRIPLHIGAANKTMLANIPEQQAAAIINKAIPAEEQERFRNTLAIIKQKGYAISRGERTNGTTSIASPIFNHLHELIGAVSIGVVDINLDDERLEFLKDRVIEAARQISNRLGYAHAKS
ncbi:IclR family transcriptional regulator [Bacillus sp. 1P06AnD]|uniref:IclR family transcriptional regulator n=1 Tax=Bacillus sp. 1P06AnD TaxID=3132208 RepID=UPI00399EF058